MFSLFLFANGPSASDKREEDISTSRWHAQPAFSTLRRWHAKACSSLPAATAHMWAVSKNIKRRKLAKTGRRSGTGLCTQVDRCLFLHLFSFRGLACIMTHRTRKQTRCVRLSVFLLLFLITQTNMPDTNAYNVSYTELYSSNCL